jgi:hypothetical protein
MPMKRLGLQCRASARPPLFAPRDNPDVASVEEVAEALAAMPPHLPQRIEYRRRERVNGQGRGSKRLSA